MRLRRRPADDGAVGPGTASSAPSPLRPRSVPAALAGVTRLVASLGDGHTGVAALGVGATRSSPVRLTVFDDGLSLTAVDSAHRAALRRHALRVGALDAHEAMRRAMRAVAIFA